VAAVHDGYVLQKVLCIVVMTAVLSCIQIEIVNVC
jgi:hypothetical protein